MRALWVWLGLVVAVHGSARAQAVDTTLWCFSPGDRVLAIGKLGHTIYLGGSFLFVGRSTGGGVPCDAHSAAPLANYPRVVGRVYTVVADGQGGWYIGGLFSYVGGQPRANLAHILADGSVAAWAPDPDLQVWAIALAGGTVYVGGDFNFVGGLPRAHLVALSPASSTPLPWVCDINSRVTSLVANGPTLFVGGWFASVAGQPRSFVAAVDLATGIPTPWQVNLDDRVSSLAMHDTTLFIGGYFWTADADTHRCVVAVGASTGAVHAWNARVDRQPPSTLDFGPHVNAMLFSGESLFVAGSFTHIGGQARQSLAQLDVGSGQATDWNPRASRQATLGPEFLSMVLVGDTLLVAGPCDSLGGQRSGQASAMSARNAEKLGWDPLTNDFVFALALQGGVVYVGGWFTSVRDWVLRPGLAAIDEVTGRVTDWDPHPDDYVKSLLVHGGEIYVGGYFGSVGGQLRSGIAALDPVTGKATPWDPSANGSVWSMAPLGDAVITAGLFSQIGGRFIRGLAAIDTATGRATAWTPNAGGDIYAVAVADSVVYVGGDYLTMGGQPRGSIASVDPVTGKATPWNPGTDGLVDAITLLNGTIYIGGFFHNVGGLPRDFLAAVDPSGSVTPWAPNAFGPNGNAEVETLASKDSTVFAGGFFSGVSGESRDYFAAMDAKTGAVRDEYPHPDGPVWALAESGGTVYVGGGFGRMGAWPQVALAAIRPSPTLSQPVSPRLLLAQSFPNPATTSAVVRYSLPVDLPVSLTLFDLQGRRSASVLSDVLQSAGPHQVSVRTDGLRAGCYLYRLEAGTLKATRKMVIVR